MTADIWNEVNRILGAAIELPVGEQAAYVAEACAGRADLRAEVESLLAAHNRAGDFIESGAIPPPPSGRRVGPYRLLEEIGRGGMGAVFRAERDDNLYQKQVAIKLIGAAMESAEALRRFRDERQILASLEHPHIARFLEAGVSSDGAPYLVMELIEGVPIHRYCKEQKLNLAARLRLFQPVCAAVHFAHQHMVVHRDIKPGNVLVTVEGEPKLLDFGVARLLDPARLPEGSTRTVMAALTPDYASPEQIRGAHTTAASDIYSLGVVLYELLAGERPYRLSGTTIEQTLEAVCHKEPPKPSSRAREIPEDLDSIVMKAMRKEPAGRYSSPQEMSDDIERFLTSKPVAARRGTFAYVSRKFIRRHKAWVAAGAAALVLLIAGTAAIAWQARIANEQRAIAQRHFDEVRKLANSVLFDLHDGIAQLPGSTPVRKKLVDRALEYLDALAKDAPGDLALQLELAAAYSRVGDVQGNPSYSNVGDFQGALASYEKARTLAERVRAQRGESLAADSLLLRLYGALQVLQTFLRNRPAALENAQRQLALADDLSRRDPGDQKRQRAVGIALDSMATALTALEKPESVEYRRRALAVFQQLLKLNPGNDNERRNVALEHKYLATHYLTVHNPEQARVHLDAARELDQQRVSANPTDRYAKLDLSFDLSQDALYARQKGDLSAALRSMREVLRIREELLLADPADARLLDRVFYARRAVADLLLRSGDAAGALRRYQELRSPMEARLAKSPMDAHARSDVAIVAAGTALAKLKLGLGAAACPEALRAASIFDRLQAEGRAMPDDTESRGALARQAAICYAGPAPAKSR